MKLLWDCTLHTGKVRENSLPDIVILYKRPRECALIGIACPFDKRVEEKEQEKLEKYNYLRHEIGRILECKRGIGH